MKVLLPSAMFLGLTAAQTSFSALHLGSLAAPGPLKSEIAQQMPKRTPEITDVKDYSSIKIDTTTSDTKMIVDGQSYDMTTGLLEDLFDPLLMKGSYKEIVDFFYNKLSVLTKEKKEPAFKWLEKRKTAITCYIRLREEYQKPEQEYSTQDVEDYWFIYILGGILIEADFKTLGVSLKDEDHYIQIREIVKHYKSRMNDWMYYVKAIQNIEDNKNLKEKILDRLHDFFYDPNSEEFKLREDLGKDLFCSSPIWLATTSLEKNWFFGRHFSYREPTENDLKPFALYSGGYITHIEAEAVEVIEKYFKETQIENMKKEDEQKEDEQKEE